MGWASGGVCAAMAWAMFWAPDASARAGRSDHFWTDSVKVRQERSAISQVARRAMPAVVAITTHQPPTNDGTATPSTQEQTGLGSGFIISSDGYILTSQHVIDGATEIKVQLWEPEGGAREFAARVVGQDKPTDSALLKIDAPDKLPVLRLGQASDVDVADWVVVIGNPFGLAHSVTVGVVSFKGRSDINPTGAPGYLDYLQTDAPINPGNSGGPILGLNGQVVAIANAVNVSGQGIGFGIPIDVAKAILPQLKEKGSVQRAWLGVSVQDLTPELSDIFHVKRHGVLIAEVVRGGPAWESGLQVGDIITELDAARVLRAQALRWVVTTKAIGHTAHLGIEREGKPFTTRIKLAELPPAQLMAEDKSAAPSVLPLGAVVDEVDASASTEAGLSNPYGALVRAVRPGSVMSDVGVTRGDIILKVNRSEISSKDELIRSLKDISPGAVVRLFVRRGEKTMFFEFKKP